MKLNIQLFAYTKKEWKDLPSKDTPILAADLNNIENQLQTNTNDINALNTNLNNIENQLQTNTNDINALNTNLNNIEDGIETNNKKLSGEEVIGNIVVDSIRTKNMFDKSTIVQEDVSGTVSTSRISTRQKLWLEAGTYTFSTNLPSTYRYGILIRPSAPPTSSTSSYDSGWLTNTSTHTFTITTAGYYMMNFSKPDNSDLTISDISSYNFQLEEGSTATEYTPYQNLDATDKKIVKTEVTPNSSYISTVQLNHVVKCDKIVTVDFRGLVSANIPNNTTIITLPYRFADAGTAPAYLGGAYDYASTLWCSWGNNGDAFRTGGGFGSASGKYVHIHLVYITSD